MLSKQDQLTELVRKLETNNHVFATDPLLITERLQDEQATPLQKIHRRAERIDSNRALAGTLNKIDGRIKGIILIMSILWCVSGFLGLFALLQSNVVNFFYVLVCLLGFHTLMLIGWLIFTVINRGSQSPSIITSFISPKTLIRGKDDVTQAAVELYDEQLQHTGMRWYLSRFSHQLWLATLTGMLFAIIFLLIVRQYSFSWESTLLSDHALMTLTHWLGWLPSMVGFNVPDADAVVQSRLVTDVMPLSIARQWASLLVGSLLMYGIVPRAIAWAFCAVMFNRKKMKLDLSLPYYQKIISFWQRKVVDEDDFVEKVQPVAPKAKVTQGNKLVALLEYKHPNPTWYHTAGEAFITQPPEDFGVLDDREDMDRMLEYLATHDVQVLLGIHGKALPDRGTMRKLDKLATHAKQGVIVQLLTDDGSIEAVDLVRRQQWQSALSERNIGLVS
ncbi:DUF2868 domain-containing protein [Psychrobacter sanguinis]|uniref:DUF2868 domain-containing protein n=1 Tax=Psychrobacter sanguinis TaxID=861445 RepID=UPI00020C608C|nr:DUF2868 domain-containing protein [Psychrobacter sanguinis]EGK15414.1 hypothetical protein HMPREF9373_0108 [Psychrobacter sp. 1501(2011)]MCD9151502.1 DUF2868 domain-containing protein [Psychrobacter sanguinis]